MQSQYDIKPTYIKEQSKKGVKAEKKKKKKKKRKGKYIARSNKLCYSMPSSS